MGHMSPKIKVRKGRPLPGWPNQVPLVTITAFDAAPSNGVPNNGFTATATDPETGQDLSANIVWTGWTASGGEGYQIVDLSQIGSPPANVGAGDPTGLALSTSGGEGVNFGGGIVVTGSPLTPTNLPIGSPEVPYTA